VKIKQNTT